MPRVEPTLLAAHIRRIAPADAPTDADLVGRYAEHRDAAAFEVLVWRHSPMVWATCRRVLSHQHDAEDAFQATFLALARAAGTLGTRQAVAGWLHRVATNAALKLRADRVTTGVAVEVSVRPSADTGELAAAVDEELARLPDRIRAAFVLCCLEGMTNTEAARELGCPVGTVNSRLHAARARLRERLARRGFGPPAGIVLVAAPAASVAAAIEAGIGGVPRPAVAALAAHAGRITTHGAITMKAGICAVLVMALAGAVWAFGSGDGPSTIPKTAPAAPPAVPAPPAPVTAWGEAVDGLQAGLRCPKRVLGRGESVEVELVLRNVGKYPVSFEYLVQSEKGVEISGRPERFELRLGWSVRDGKPGRDSACLRQNEEFVRGRVTLTHAEADAVLRGSRIQLAPGTYRVRLEGDPGDRLIVSQPGKGSGSEKEHGQERADFPALETGVLELVLPADEPVKGAPAPAEPQIVLWRDGRPLAIDPGTKGTTPLGTEFKGKPGAIRIGPAGRSLVYVRNRTTPRPANVDKQDKLYVRDGMEQREVGVGVSPRHAFWGADGIVYGHGFSQPKWGDPEPPPDLTKDFVNWSFDPRTRSGLPLDASDTQKALKKLPGNVAVLDRSPDGKSFLAFRYEMPPGAAPGAPGAWADYRLGLLTVEGGDFVPLTKLGEPTPGDFRFSPDGRSILGTMSRKEGDKLVPELVVFDLKTKARTAVKVPGGAHVHASCWSPDGKRIAFVWESEAAYQERMNRFGPVDPRKVKKPVYTVTVAKPDGSEVKDVYTESEFEYGSIDWGVPAAVQPPVAPGVGDVIRPRQPGGVLGDRLGEYLTVEGVKNETGTFLVDTVDGKKLDKPVTILVRVHDFDATRFDKPVGYVMNPGRRTILKGFESGEMIGVPEGVRAAAKELGRTEVPVSPKAWQWRPYFVALIISEPKAEPGK